MQCSFIKILMGVFLSLGLTACVNQNTTRLYDDLGQRGGIEAIVHELILIIAKDERLLPRYKGANMQRFKQGLTDYICVVSEGPCKYTGDTLKAIHAGHNYTNTEFNAIVDGLIFAMEKKNIPVAAQNRLLARLAPTYRDVVYQ